MRSARALEAEKGDEGLAEGVSKSRIWLRSSKGRVDRVPRGWVGDMVLEVDEAIVV